MSRHNVTNAPASVRAKLLNKSRLTKRPFSELLQYYAIERFLYRLSISKHRDSFFLKGALMFKAWNTLDHRPTMDIDLLGKTNNSVQNLETVCHDICDQVCPVDDGIVFFSHSVKGTKIQADAEYLGVRIEFQGKLNTAIVNMQIDIGFGDIISPKPQMVLYPIILDLPAPQLSGYTIESVIAEKLESMVKRGILTSRVNNPTAKAGGLRRDSPQAHVDQGMHSRILGDF